MLPKLDIRYTAWYNFCINTPPRPPKLFFLTINRKKNIIPKGMAFIIFPATMRQLN